MVVIYQDSNWLCLAGKPHWVEVLTEILLSLLTRPSNLLRHVVDQVFSAISSHLTEGALQLILDVSSEDHSS